MSSEVVLRTLRFEALVGVIITSKDAEGGRAHTSYLTYSI